MIAMKELFIEAPKTTAGAYDRMTDRLADRADRLRQEAKDRW